ncbi:unnamed protein product [Caenorhabditis angaria]|uniref:PDZ domain-containing protein n=1 Tax=Caenorhabditis angaria TaxID=860376 RepID=A0A9P1IA87_9PELO|nr:unnamed protein product [Caenorhabditis angaria]
MAAAPIPSKRQARRAAFKSGVFPEDLISPEMIKTFSFSIECAAGQPRLRDFKLSKGMLLMRVPQFMAPPIEYGDYLVKINDTPITTKKEMEAVLTQTIKTDKTHFPVFTVKRIMSMVKITEGLPTNAAIKKPKSNDPQIKPTDGYVYYKLVLIYFPRANLGINIKSYNNVVYVESTDNTWGSTTRRFLYVGDAILKIDDTEVFDLKETGNMLKTALTQNGIATIIVERAVEPLAANYVRSVLSFNKCNDPQLAMDTIKICKTRHDHHVKNGFGPEPKSIFKVQRKGAANKVTVTDNVKTKLIGCEQYNPLTMVKCPNYTDATNVAKAMGSEDRNITPKSRHQSESSS